MNVKNQLLFLALLFISCRLSAQDESDVIAYIARYKTLAIAEQIRAGVPAAITLAQGIHESTAGTSELATKGNNHFGIKCKTNWMGETILHDDDKKQECFRKYVSAEQSYIDHSDFLKIGNRYHFLFDLEITDYSGWASGLKRAGYATNPDYVKKLTDLVEKYNLQKYTYEAISQSNHTIIEPVAENNQPRNLTQTDDPSTYYKGLKGFWAKKGETLLPKALEKNIRYAKLLALNDLPDEPLQNDMFVFIEKKRRIGTEEFHIVKANENMLMISQKEAILLSNLIAYNNLLPGQEPQTGERLALQYKSYETPKTKQQFLKELEPAIASYPEIAVVRENKAAVQIKEQPNTIEPTPAIKPEVRKSEPEPVRVAKVEKVIENEPVKEAPKPIVQEMHQNQEVVRETMQDPPAKQNTTIIIETKKKTGNSAPIPAAAIIDPEKAKRMDDLLNSQPLEKQSETAPPAEKTIIRKQTVNESPFAVRAQDPEPAKSKIAATTEQEVIPLKEKEEVPIAEKQPDLPPPPRVKRTYNEPGVSDSVKALKEKFDEIVYSPRPPRKADTSRKTITPTPSILPDPKKGDASISGGKKNNVQVTTTGIKRDLKKEAEVKGKSGKHPDSKKKEDLKKSVSKKNSAAAKKGATSNPKEKKKAAESAKKNNSKKPLPGKKTSKKR